MEEQKGSIWLAVWHLWVCFAWKDCLQDSLPSLRTREESLKRFRLQLGFSWSMDARVKMMSEIRSCSRFFWSTEEYPELIGHDPVREVMSTLAFFDVVSLLGTVWSAKDEQTNMEPYLTSNFRPHQVFYIFCSRTKWNPLWTKVTARKKTRCIED